MHCAVEKELKQFDFVQFTIPDIHGIPRGRLVPAEVLSQACRDGVGIFSGTQCLGLRGEIPDLQTEEFDKYPNGIMRPLSGTVRPLMWSSVPGRQIGHVMCQLEFKGRASEACPRFAAQRQIERLAKKGLLLKSAFECECNFLKTENLEPLGGDVIPFASFDLMDRNLDLFTTMLRTLRDSGVRVEYFFPEYQAGQYETSIQPQFGVEAADDAFMYRYGVRAFCHRQGLSATFLAMPFSHFHSAGYHFNHSLWSQEGRSLFHDPMDALKLSSTARHWLAGLLEHAPALTALSCPTANCYHRLGTGYAPGVIYWNMDDRLCTFRAKISDNNVYLENRIPSPACNPYLTLASTIAAGLDGVERRLQHVTPGTPDKNQIVRQVPASLGDALDALEKDTVITEALGKQVIDCFLTLKRNFEVAHFQKVTSKDMDMADVITKEREYYLPLI